MVEPQIVVLVVAGSSPVGHPAYEVPNPKAQTPNNHFIWSLEPGIWDFKLVPVAQPDRASDFGSEGWGFESLQARFDLIYCGQATYIRENPLCFMLHIF